MRKMIPLSYTQRRMWLLHQLEEAAETYNMAAAFRLAGALDRDALAAALSDVIERHEVLRTVYETDADGQPSQRILPVSKELVPLPVVEVASDGVSGVIDEAIAYRFDLAAEIPFRASLLRCSSQEHVLVLVMHHIAMDGSSSAPLARDLADAYAARLDGRAPGWEPLPVQYKDYTLWQREVLGDVADPGSLAAAQVDYWRTELAGVPQPLSLPLDRPRPVEAASHGDTVALAVGPEVTAGLEKLAMRPWDVDVDGPPGGAGGAAAEARRWGGCDDRQPDGLAGPTKRWPIWSAPSSTLWCCGWTCPVTRRSTSCLRACGTRRWRATSTRTCRSRCWSRRSTLTAPWRTRRSSR